MAEILRHEEIRQRRSHDSTERLFYSFWRVRITNCLAFILDAPADGVTGERTETNSLLFRATDGNADKRKKVKFSTVVAAEDIEGFWTKYTEVVRSGMVGLRKKEKKKKLKNKAKK